MNPIEQELLRELKGIDDAAARMAAGAAGEGVLPHVRRIAELKRLLPAGTDPQLLHYLAKNSYGKARSFLEGRGDSIVDGPGGHCGEPRP